MQSLTGSITANNGTFSHAKRGAKWGMLLAGMLIINTTYGVWGNSTDKYAQARLVLDQLEQQAACAPSSQVTSPAESQPPVLIPLVVVDDLIRTGQFEAAQDALDSWAENKTREPGLSVRQENLARARKAAQLLGKAERQAIRVGATENLPTPPAATTASMPSSAQEDRALEEAASLFAKGYAAEQSDNLEQAAQFYQQVLLLFPDSLDAQSRLLRVQSELVEETAPSPVYAKDPILDIAPVYDRGVQYFESGRYDKASRAFQEVLATLPDHVASQEYLRQIQLLEKGTVRQTVALANTAPSPNPRQITAPVVEEKSIPVQSQSQPSQPSQPVVATAVQPSVQPVMNDPWVEPSDSRQVAMVEEFDPFAADSYSAPDSSVGNEQPLSVQDLDLDSWDLKAEQPVETELVPIAMEEEPVVPDSIESFLRSSSQRMAQAPEVEMDDQWATAEENWDQTPPIEPDQATAVEEIDVVPVPVPAESTTPVEQAPVAVEDPRVVEYIETGLRSLQRNDIITAFELWQQAVAIEPGNPVAMAFMEKYQDDYNRAVRAEQELAAQRAVDDQIASALDRKIRLEQGQDTDINAFLATVADLANVQIITGEGVSGRIHAIRSTELTLKELLDRVLPMNGYAWQRSPGSNVIEVRRDIVTQRFPLNEQQYQALKRLAMSATGAQETDDLSEPLRQVILGSSDPNRALDVTIPGQRFVLNKYLQELIVRDSRHNVHLVEQFLQMYNRGDIRPEEPPLIVETFRLPKRTGRDLARVINMRLFGQAEWSQEFEENDPYLIYDERTNMLIIRHDPEKIELVKRLMEDPKFLGEVHERKLKARRFWVVPREDRFNDTPDAVARRRRQVLFAEKVMQDLLYGSRIAEANAEGRFMHSDPDEGAIDVVDTPENLDKVEEYLSGISSETALVEWVKVQNREINDMIMAVQGLVLMALPSYSSMGGMGGMNMGSMGGGMNMGSMGGGSMNMGSMGGGSMNMGTSGNLGNMNIGATNMNMGGIGGGMNMGGMGSGFGGGYNTNPYQIQVIVRADAVTKSLMVMGQSSSEINRAINLINRLDEATDQVEVEVRLVELRYSSDDSMGITMAVNNILAADDGDAAGPGMTLNNAILNMNTAPLSNNTLTLATLGKSTIDATLNMLSKFTDVRILTAPKLTVTSGMQGSVFLGEKVPYVENIDYVVPAGSDTPVLSTQTGTLDVGFQLMVMPFVTGDGSHIEMVVMPQIETVGERLSLPLPTGGTSNVGQPSINTRQAQVRVRVSDGDTIVIGGLLRQEETHTEGRTPLLGYIPGLSSLFTEKSQSDFTQNLLIMVTAHVIEGTYE